MVYLITGGAGFIGSSVIRYLLQDNDNQVVNVDKLTYAGCADTNQSVAHLNNYIFELLDICDYHGIKGIFEKYQPDKVMHLAAESHVDRSIDSPSQFIQTNIIGTYNLIQVSMEYWENLEARKKCNFRFHHVSTDEVYGDLEISDNSFTEETPYNPSSPYSATKAGSDHLVRAWNRTYGLPVVITNCSNNYGPYQFPEKLIPLVIVNAINKKPIPVYGDGSQIRDWLYVEDHAKSLVKVMLEGDDGETYNIGGNNELKNIDVVKTVCSVLDEIFPLDDSNISSYSDLIRFVEDRPGHDLRYAINSDKIYSKLGWKPEESFQAGIRKTVEWYLANNSWWSSILSGDYHGQRLGIKRG